MSQKLSQMPSIFQMLVVLQCLLVTIATAYPYVVVSSSSALNSEPRKLVKRAFDRFDNSGVFSFGAKRFEFDGYDVKRAFDRLDNSDFNLRRKRSFDRLGGTEFGLMKRSPAASSVNGPSRNELINELTESIMALRKARSLENSASVPVVISYDSSK